MRCEEGPRSKPGTFQVRGLVRLESEEVNVVGHEEIANLQDRTRET